MPSANAFWKYLRGKKVAVCGIGRNNTPVIRQFLSHGAVVTACDRRTREDLGETAADLERAGAVLKLGESYLSSLDTMDLILRTPGMKPYLPPFMSAREKGIPVTSEMEIFFALCPCPIYAVTGSDGKTTTATIMAGLLEASGKNVFLGGNIGRPLMPEIDKISPSDATVVEMSSFQLTMMDQSPYVAVVTNISPNHLDWHTDMDEYIEAKRNLVAHQKTGDRAVLNADDPITASFAQSTRADVLFFSRAAEQSGTWLRDDGWLCMTRDGVTTPIVRKNEIRLPGEHNLENYLAAFAAVWGEVEPAVMAEYAGTFAGVPHRCELVRERNGVKWYNDSIGTSPSRTVAGLRSFDRKVILIAGGYDKHIPYDPLGRAAAQTVKAAVLMGDTASAIERAIRRYSTLPIVRVNTMEEAVSEANRLAGEGDCVFLSPASASFDKYRNFEERGEHFRKCVEALPPV